MRRSVASGDAVFPLSDLDFDITVDDACGASLERLRARYQIARCVFPRTGQCFVIHNDDLEELAATEPYRASINRRCFFMARGEVPRWPAYPILPSEAARRVVFWLQDFFPLAVRSGWRRHQRKFYLEMCNALGVLEGRWNEPLISLRDVSRACPAPKRLFVEGLQLAARASNALGRVPPHVERAVCLAGLTILTRADEPWPESAMTGRGPVVTAAALDLLLQTQCPWLWMEHGTELARMGFEPPSRFAWIRAARRLAGVLWLRGPGFFEPRSRQQDWRVSVARSILDSVERSETPRSVTMPETRMDGARSYYLRTYDRLSDEAAELRARARALEALMP